MSSGNDVTAETESYLTIDRGAQALVSLTSMASPLRILPPEAFENLLLVSTKSPDEIEDTLDEMGVDPSSVGVIPVSGSDTEYDGRLSVTEPIVPDDLTGLSMRYSNGLDALVPDHGWVVFDSLNVFLLYADEDRVVRFFDHVTARARERDLRGVYAIVGDAVDDQHYARLCRSVDVEIDRS